MLYRVIDTDELSSLIRGFMDDYEFIAPVKADRGYVFDVVDDPSKVELDYVTTITSPKKYFLPSEEVLMRYSAEENEITDYSVDIKPRVIFGVHPCDINALNRLDLVYKDAPYPDPYYIKRRENTLIIGMSCMPGPNCFCNLFGTDEARMGADMFMQKIGDKYIISLSSVEASSTLERYCNPQRATDEDRKEFRRATREREAAFNKDIPHVQEIAMMMDVFHRDEFWTELGNRCQSCSACASVCPTCFCFDIYDRLDPDGKNGSRIRSWDACTSPEFALVAGGHNFRGDNRRRVRHRFYHKLNGFTGSHDYQLCVGCGRCVTACKANINPIEVLKFFDRKGAEQDGE